MSVCGWNDEFYTSCAHEEIIEAKFFAPLFARTALLNWKKAWKYPIPQTTHRPLFFVNWERERQGQRRYDRERHKATAQLRKFREWRKTQ